MKRKHYKLICAWADGAIIEKFDSANDEWVEVRPTWATMERYRIKNNIAIKAWNEHSEVIIAFWEGNSIESKIPGVHEHLWTDCLGEPLWKSAYQYRVKGEKVYEYQWYYKPEFGPDKFILTSTHVTEKEAGCFRDQKYFRFEPSKRIRTRKEEE